MKDLKLTDYRKKVDTLINYTLYHSQSGEQWKEIENIKYNHGLYFISTHGRVLSLYHNKPRILKPFISNGYKYVTICGQNFRVNRLVALAFIPNPDKKPIVHHIDHNKLNNMVNNLQWATDRENAGAYQQYKKEKNIGE